ncbi:acyl-CoA dehydrogenase [Microbulbifer sp. 2205BS26-8]|uniref:acyl-CoA dehydrogenase n=1 Tax=Microbulbifer sp. 2205BS26-8 TaxID=3064386 RepID=UPI00273EED0E|nr:acyl-CoA dehydrogenase [Microbulbifer sp. 2205BS26-8]MDP5209270.1 acyl-CoA dehydrogenase [Microbulbifer sp. 2205BS26-8]
MDFRYTQIQQDLIEAASAMLNGENTLDRLRDLINERKTGQIAINAQGSGLSHIWGQFSEVGLLGLMAREADGGLEQPLVLMAGVAEAAGYVALPEPLIELAGIVVPLLSQMNKPECLTQVLEGRLLVGIITPLLPFNNTTAYHDMFIVTSEMGGELVLKKDLNLESRKSIDPLRKLAKANKPSSQNALADYHGAVLSAAQLLGLSKRMIDMSCDFAKKRHQFGRPIGSFQAIKHQLATAYMQIEFTRPMIQLAALQGGVAVHNAKLTAIDTAMLVIETAIQVHGGMGYTYEVDLHLFMKRAWALCGEWGDRNYHMKKLEEYLLNDEMDIGQIQTFIQEN